jgi:hypothetical protein
MTESQKDILKVNIDKNVINKKKSLLQSKEVYIFISLFIICEDIYKKLCKSYNKTLTPSKRVSESKLITKTILKVMQAYGYKNDRTLITIFGPAKNDSLKSYRNKLVHEGSISISENIIKNYDEYRNLMLTFIDDVFSL